MGSISDDNQDMEDPYQGSTNVEDNANRAEGNHRMSHTMNNSYEMRGTTHWKKSTEELYGQRFLSVKKHGGKKRQKMYFPISESIRVETDSKKRNKTGDDEEHAEEHADEHAEEHADEHAEEDASSPKGINVQVGRSKENTKYIYCHHCDVNIEAKKLEEHNQSEHIKCPIDNCGQIYKIDDLDVHLLNHIKNEKDEVILNDSKEIEKWIHERKKNYPTRERIAIDMKDNENGKKKKKAKLLN
ncbi:hypothetical protein PCYB_124120 [Plasmodium cynomolgi strain B]|uniref:FMR1-interacting protein 1 conserved domain-containing protein n=1 Tax=Plasmodium cynomolgi (strain B) TaxID=1120755 RepID=K6UE72_PLACD|nr:hypothetical protein PCYB_124120 [Plasmodium cynomolgi strain B]GAB67846.1 hypothetical protein PCYB_124120 [Plasmodium cynomolgi strain B]